MKNNNDNALYGTIFQQADRQPERPKTSGDVRIIHTSTSLSVTLKISTFYLNSTTREP